MNKKKNQETQNTETTNNQQPINKEILKKLFKDGKVKILDCGRNEDYKVSTGSLNFDMITGGGFGPGIIRFVGATEGGKEQPIDEPVLTESGFIEIGKLSVGDKVYTYNGTLSEVTGVYPQGKKMTYKVSFDDGTFTFCGKSHLWQVVPEENGKLLDKRVWPLEEIMKNTQYEYNIPLCAPIQFPENKLVISPLELGKLLACKTSLSGLIAKRIIPNLYLYSSISDRKNLLLGLSNGDNEFNTNSITLFKGLLELIRGLGGHTSKIISDENGHSISWTFNKHYKKIVSIEKEKLAPCVCIKIADDKGLYITRDYIVTHNTSEALAVVDNFLDKFGEKGRALYIKCEHRLSDSIKGKSKHPFVTMTMENPDEAIDAWDHTNILVYPNNNYKDIQDFLVSLEVAFSEDIKLIFVFDSLDHAIPPGYKEAVLAGDTAKIAGQQKFTKDLLRVLQPEWVKRNWMSIWLSQVSSSIQTNKFEVQSQMGGEWSGGNAILHASDWIIQFFKHIENVKEEKEKQADPISNKIVGKNAKIGIVKSVNETTGYKIQYPIKNDNGIWKEKEICDYLETHILNKKGAWFSFPEKTIKLAIKNGLNLPEKVNGSNKLLELIEKNPDIYKFFYDGFMKAILKGKININTFAEEFSEEDIAEINKGAKD